MQGYFLFQDWKRRGEKENRYMVNHRWTTIHRNKHIGHLQENKVIKQYSLLNNYQLPA